MYITIVLSYEQPASTAVALGEPGNSSAPLALRRPLPWRLFFLRAQAVLGMTKHVTTKDRLDLNTCHGP
jgi:hypothetical protein